MSQIAKPTYFSQFPHEITNFFFNSTLLLIPFLPEAQQPNSGLGRLTIPVSVSHTHTHTHTHSVGVLWTSEQLLAEAATYTTQNRRKSMS